MNGTTHLQDVILMTIIYRSGNIQRGKAERTVYNRVIN